MSYGRGAGQVCNVFFDVVYKGVSQKVVNAAHVFYA